MAEKKLMKIGKVATAAGVLPSTIRYYTDLGLLEVADYTKGGQRLYDMDVTLAKLRIIRGMGKQRLSLDTVKKVIEDHKKATME